MQVGAYRYGNQYLPINPFGPYSGPSYVAPNTGGSPFTPSSFPNHLVPPAPGSDFNPFAIPIHT